MSEAEQPLPPPDEPSNEPVPPTTPEAPAIPNDEATSYKISLSRLNKILEGSSSHSKKAYRVMASYGVSEDTSISVSPGPLLLGPHEDYLAHKAEELSRIARKNRLAHLVRVARLDLKGFLFSANVQTGVHQLLTELSILQAGLEFSSQFKGKTNGRLLTKEEFDELKARSKDQHVPEISGRLYTHVEQAAERDVRTIRKKMLEVREKIQHINHGTQVEIRVLPEVAIELGLE